MIDQTETPSVIVENALLRGSLYLVTNVLKDYHGAHHTKTEDGRLQLVVPESVRLRASEAIDRATRLLKHDGRGR